jgi:NADPH:quinone reductase
MKIAPTSERARRGRMVGEKLQPVAEGPASPEVHSSTMRAAVIASPGKIEVAEVPIPEPDAGQVLIRLEGCGVCASNIPPWEGREWFSYPMAPGALGHEGWGRIVAVGSGVPDLTAGQRVAFQSEKAYAEYDVADAEACVPLPDSLSNRPFPGEPLGCAMNIFRRSGIELGSTVAIVGIGFLGAMLTQLAKAKGARVIAISRREFSLQFARDAGADELIPMDDHWRIIEEVKRLTDQRFCDVVVECVGKEWPLNLSAELTKERGRLVVAGYHQDGLRSVNMQLWNWRGLDVINAHEREREVYIQGIRDAVDAVAEGRLNPFSLMTHQFELAELDQALNSTRDRPDGFMKAYVNMCGKQ